MLSTPTPRPCTIANLRAGAIRSHTTPMISLGSPITENPHPMKLNVPDANIKHLCSPPSSTTLKWNVDASMKISNSKASIGGVLRDHHGKFIYLFSSLIPFMEINHAEIFATHRALKISLTMENARNSKLIVESDSANAVSWCTGENNGPWNLTFIINFIGNLRKEGLGGGIVHKNRESNVVASH